MKSNKKLVGPFTVRIEGGSSWKTEKVASAHEAQQIAKRLIAKWQVENLSQLRAGAYLYANRDFSISKSVKIFNADDKLVTHEILTAKF